MENMPSLLNCWDCNQFGDWQGSRSDKSWTCGMFKHRTMIAAEGTMVYTVEETSRGIMDIMLINKMPMSGRTAERKSGKPVTWKMAILLV